jgi:salicylate hydroxylase
MSTIKDARIAVIGGGLAGFAFANAAQYNELKNVTIYEQAKEFRQVGAGITLSQNAYRCLDQYGLKEALLQVANEQSEVNVVRYGRSFRHYKTGEQLVVVAPLEKPNRRIHRAHLLDVLKAKLPKEMLKTNKRLLTIEKNGNDEKQYVLHFADGTIETADIVIGCDGIHSVVRKYLGIIDDPEYSGQVVYRGLLPQLSLPKETVDLLQLQLTFFRGNHRFLFIYPIGQGEKFLYNVGAFMPEPLSKFMFVF